MGNDPLQQLRDIHLPADPSWWPPAFGWWLLFAAGLAVVWYLARAWRARRLAERPKHAALAELANAGAAFETGGLSANQYAHALNGLLKRLWLHVLGERQVASLQGEAWLAYLDERSGGAGFRSGPGRWLGDQRFAPSGQPLEETERRTLEAMVGALIRETKLATRTRSAGMRQHGD